MNREVEDHLSRADELLHAAQELLRLDLRADSVSRSYYAMFHAATAVLLKRGIQRSSHHALWAAFGQFVTAPGLMHVRDHRAGLQMFTARVRSDYLAKPQDTPEIAQKALHTARDFVAACRSFLDRRNGP